MSTEQKKTKTRYTNITPEMSMKLKLSQSKVGYIKKHGEVEGNRLWLLTCANKQRSKTLDRYIEIHGVEEGTIKWNEYCVINATKMSKESFIKKHGIEEGVRLYNNAVWNNKNSNTKDHYIKIHGEEEGTFRWNLKNYRNSKSSTKVSDSELYKIYKTSVLRYTRNTIANTPIKNIHIIKKGEYALDHKVSILEGFRHRIPTWIIGSVHNLEVIEHTTNSSKQEKCSITIPELLSIFYND